MTESALTPPLSGFAIWHTWKALTPELARHAESLGFASAWVGGSPSADLDIVERLLDATSTLTVATGIVNIWQADPAVIATSFHRLEARHPGRFLLGVGVGHPEAVGAVYQKPYEALVGYLDALDAGGVPSHRRALAALGPKVLRLAADRTAGAHPYLTTPEHTRIARETLGPDPILAPEQRVVLEADPQRARAVGGPTVATPYLGLANYRNNLLRLGFTEADLADGGSDRLIDALVAHGDDQTVAGRLRDHLDAGANQVAIQLLPTESTDLFEGYRRLAAALSL